MRAYWKIFNPWYMIARHKEMVETDWRHRCVARNIPSSSGPVLDVGGTERANIGLYVPNYTVTVNKNPELKPNILWDGSDLPFKDESFPNVVCIATIHEQHDKFTFFCELKRVASKRLIIYDCNTRKLTVTSLSEKGRVFC